MRGAAEFQEVASDDTPEEEGDIWPDEASETIKQLGSWKIKISWSKNSDC